MGLTKIAKLILIPVESSHIAAIGYLEAEHVLLVRFLDGSLYARPKVEPHEWRELEAAPSKGAWLKRWADLIRISRKEDADGLVAEHIGQQYAGSTGPATTEVADPLNVIDEDADKCCRKTLNAMFARGIDQRLSAECNDCGTQFWPEKIGECCYWRIKSNVAIVRRGR